MQRIGDEYQVLDPNGNAVPNAVVTVVDSASQVALASVYESAGSFTAPASKANGFTTDTLGRWRIALPDGRYDFQISGSTFPTYTIPSVAVFDSTVTYPSPMLGTVTSVGLTLPASVFSATAAVTAAGVLNPTFNTQTANTFFAGPSSAGPSVPTFRAMALADLPAHGPAAATYGSATQTPVAVVNAQGIVTGLSNVTVTPAWGSVTGKPTTTIALAPTDGVACVFRQTASVTVANSVVETTLIGAGQGSVTLAANQLKAGSTIRIKAMGFCSVANAAHTARFKLKGGVAGATILLDTTAQIVTNALSLGSDNFCLESVFTVRTTGSPGTGFGQIQFLSAGTTAPVVNLPLAITAATSPDTAVSNQLDFTIQWGTANPGTTITVTNLQIFVEG